LLPVVKSVVTKVQAVKGQVDSVRLFIAQDAFHVWLKQPVLGVGPGDFWAYDQVFTNLPRSLRNFNATGLGVAHDGYLQVLGELGPLGLLFWIAFPIVVFLLAFRLYRRVSSTMPRIRRKGNLLHMIDLGLFADADPKRRRDAMLALVCMGLIVGSAVGDTFSGGFFLSPRQISALNDVPQIVSSWIIWAAVMYKDKLWRLARKAARVDGRDLTAGEYYNQVSEGANTYT
jgi:O-antigen ligase